MSDLNKSDPFWIYGSGTFALEAFQQCKSEGFEVLGILDNDLADFALFKQIDVPTHNVCNFDNFENLPVYLAICNPYANLHSISKELSYIKGFSTAKSPVDLVTLFHNTNSKLERYWLTSNLDLYDQNQKEISKLFELFEDEKSKILLNSILKYRSSGKIEDLPSPDPAQEQYLPLDVRTPPRAMNIVEFGSCGGENLSTFLDMGFEITNGYTFEPDMDNYQILTSRVQALEIQNLAVLPLAAWSQTTPLRFNGSGSTNSAISPRGETFVQATSLSDLLPKSFQINYLKMDIEGAELNALAGASNVIERYHPHLAVCVYHTPEHLWEIPLWINANFPGVYSFFLRTYAEQTFETVIYCVPN